MNNPIGGYPRRDIVHRVDSCVLRAGKSLWRYAQDAAAAIEVEWREAQAGNPNYFNGSVYLVDALSLGDGAFNATLLRSNFKSYLYWRARGYPECGVRDGFGSALIRANDGAYLLGRQRSGNINSGLTYLPGGFIDDRDVADDGSIDIAASIARELYEETGLTEADVTVLPGYLITETDAQLSIATTFQSPLDSLDLKSKIERHLAADPKSELDSVSIISTIGDLDGLPMPRYARVLLGHLLVDVPASA